MKFARTFTSPATALADLKMNYTNLSHPIAFAGINAVERWYGKTLPRKIIRDELATYESYTMHREYHDGKRNPYFIYAPRQRMEIDLLDIAKYKEENDGITFLVMLIDCWTRNLWVRPIQNKSADAVLAAVHSMFNEIGEYPRHLGGDSGLEFTNKDRKSVV